MPDIWGIAASASKFALYLGILTAAGSVITALAFRLEAYRRAAVGFASIGILAALLAFSLRGALLTGDASGMFDLEMLALLWGTPIGTALAYRLIGLGLLILGLFMGRKGLWLALFGGILALWSFDHVGHIPDRDSVLLNIALTFHLIAIAFWIGILMPLKRLASQKETWAQAADLGHRFGQYASVIVPLLIVVGGYMGYQLVGSISALLTTGYGQALLLKILLVTILLGLAAANKLRFIPKLRARDENAAHHLVQSIRIEWIVILCVLGVTAVLTSNLTLPM